jgi:putative Holliday junction resolvase
LRIIALDVGDKTVGIALSDELLMTAQGLKTLERIGIRKDTSRILEIVNDYQCSVIVVGLPKKLDGTDSPQTEKVYEFKTMLENKLRSTGKNEIEVVFQDERFTTLMAEKVLISADVSRKKRKEVIDKQAAVLILQGYLDRLAFIKNNPPIIG